MSLFSSIKKLFIISVFFIQCSLASANEHGTTIFDTATVQQQIDYVIKKSTTYEQYKVIKTIWVNKLKSNIIDSLSYSASEIRSRDQLLVNKSAEIDSLENTLTTTTKLLKDVTKEKNSMNLFGASINKAAYNTLMYSLIIGLLVVLVFVLMLFSRSKSIADRYKTDLSEVQEEFENHRKRAREREEKLSRRYLDEILKYKNRASV